MKITGKVGLVLVVLGAIVLLLGFIKFRSRQEVFRIGDFRASTTAERSYPGLRYGGLALVVVGGLLLFGGSGRSGNR
jgi:hypothetical protein